jgi:Na+/serine symporter
MDIKHVKPFQAAFVFKLYSINLQYLLFEFLMVVIIKIIVFWDVKPGNLIYITNVLKEPAAYIFATGSSETLVPNNHHNTR